MPDVDPALLKPDNPLFYACPSCNAPPGQICRNYLGKGCAPHSCRNDLARPEAWKHPEVARKQRETHAGCEQLDLF